MIRHCEFSLVLMGGAPRVCGDDPQLYESTRLQYDVLPAYAGMIPGGGVHRCRWPGAPRVCGDDPMIAGTKRLQEMCSPRMRG